MKLFDSHCHLDDRSFDPDRDAVIDRAARQDVKAMMVAGIDLDRSRRAVELAQSRPTLFAAVGVHPHLAKTADRATLAQLQDLAREPNVKAWGETGLDYNRMFSPVADQERAFIRQIEIARKLDLPLILHERDSGGRFLEIVRQYFGPEQNGVVHCFSGNGEELAAYLELGLYIGVTGILTHKARGTDLRRLVAAIPRERLLIETDAPYLTPSPERNRYRRNEPGFVRRVWQRLAEVRGEDPHALAATLWNNTLQLFRIESLAYEFSGI